MQTTNNDLKSSGAHQAPFYTDLYIASDDIEIEKIEWSPNLHRDYRFDKEDLDGLSDDEINDEIYTNFTENAFMFNFYNQVDIRDYDEVNAYKCV